MSLVQLSCLVPTASSGNPNTSGLFNVFMVLWVLSYMSKVPGAQQCTTHNRKKPLQPEVWWELQESSSAAAGPLSCHSVQCSPTSAGVTTTKVSLLSPLGTLWPEHPQLTLCIWMFLWANPTHCSYLLQISTFFLSVPLSAFLSTLSLWPYSVFITLHCLNIPSKTWVLQKRNPNAKRRQKYLIHKQLVCRNPGVIT